MAKRKKSSKGVKAPKGIRIITPDFLRRDRRRYLRLYSKTIRFNQVEMEYIDEFCRENSIKSKASFYRECVLRTVMEESSKNYPTLF